MDKLQSEKLKTVKEAIGSDFLERDGKTFVYQKTKSIDWSKEIPAEGSYSEKILSFGTERRYAPEELIMMAHSLASRLLESMDLPNRVRLVLNSTNFDSCTDKKVILASTKVLDDMDIDLPHRLDAFLGTVEHEGLHVEFTDLNVRNHSKLAHCILNIIEDERIEHLAGEKYPGLAGYLKFFKYYYFEKFRKDIKDELSDPRMKDIDRFINELIVFVRYPSMIKDESLIEWGDYFIRIHKLLKNWPQTTSEALEISEKIMEIIKDLIKDELRKQNHEKQEGGKSKKESEGSSDNKEDKKKDGKFGEDDQEGNEGDGSSESNSSEKDGSSDSGNGKEDSEDSDEDEDSEDDDESDNASDGDDEDDSFSDDPDTDSDGSDSDEDEDSEDDDESDNASDGDDEDDSFSDDPDTDSDGSDSDEDEDSGDDDESDNEDENDCEPTESEVNDIVNQIVERLSEFLDSIDNETREEMSKAVKNDSNIDDIIAGNIERSSDSKTIFINSSKPSDMVKGQDERDVYNQSLSRVRRFIPAMKNILVSAGTTLHHNLRGCREGHFDEYKLAEAYQGSQNVYKQVKEEKSNRIAVCILVDESGSMWGKKIEAARDTAVLLNEALGSLPNVDLYIYGHTADCKNYGETQVYCYRDKKNRSRHALGQIDARCNNADGYAIVETAKRVRSQTSEKILFFVISDGQPAASIYNTFDEGIAHTRKAVKTIEGMGCVPVQISIDQACTPELMFDNYVKLTDMAQLPKQLASIIRKAILASTSRK